MWVTAVCIILTQLWSFLTEQHIHYIESLRKGCTTILLVYEVGYHYGSQSQTSQWALHGNEDVWVFVHNQDFINKHEQAIIVTTNN